MRNNHVSLPSTLRGLGIAVMLVLFVLYVSFQARFLIQGPQITMTKELATIQKERTITLVGGVKNITNITVNGNPILTDENGDFAYTIVLENGYNKTSIQAHDRYGRTATLIKEFVYTPQSLLPS